LSQEYDTLVVCDECVLFVVLYDCRHPSDYLLRVGLFSDRPNVFAHPDIWLQDWSTVTKQLGVSASHCSRLSPARRVTPDCLPTQGPEAEVCDASWPDAVARFNRQANECLTIAVSPQPGSASKRSPLKLLSPKQMWSSIKKTFSKPPTHSRTPTGARSTRSQKSCVSRTGSENVGQIDVMVDSNDKENTPPQSGQSSESAHTTPATASSAASSQAIKRSLFGYGVPVVLLCVRISFRLLHML
jgi:hypothetical protein